MDLIAFFWYVLVIILSAIPLNIAVKLLGGRSSLIKVIFANLLVAVFGYIIQDFVGFFAGLITFIIMLFVYKVLFHMGWIRSFLAWLLQFVLIAIFFILLFLAGIFAIV